jgi:hypothetical protein
MGPTPPLPRFLQPSQSCSHTQALRPIHATYSHQRPFGPAQVLWWPCTSQDPRTVLLFIPGPRTLLYLPSLLKCNFSGNPGLLDLYIPFLDSIYSEANSPITLFAHAHLGLSSYIGGDRSFPDVPSVSLPAHIRAHVEFLDKLLASYGPKTNVLLVGHSIGAWLIQEMLKTHTLTRHIGAFMLFPAISEISRSPSGKILSVRMSVPCLLYSLSNYPHSLSFVRLGRAPLLISRCSYNTYPSSSSASSCIHGRKASCKSCIAFCNPPLLYMRVLRWQLIE